MTAPRLYLDEDVDPLLARILADRAFDVLRSCLPVPFGFWISTQQKACGTEWCGFRTSSNIPARPPAPAKLSPISPVSLQAVNPGTSYVHRRARPWCPGRRESISKL